MAHNVIKERTKIDLMVAIIGMYKKSSTNNKLHLMKKLFNLKMSKGTSITQHLNKFNSIKNQLFLAKIEFDYEIKAFCCHCC